MEQRPLALQSLLPCIPLPLHSPVIARDKTISRVPEGILLILPMQSQSCWGLLVAPVNV